MNKSVYTGIPFVNIIWVIRFRSNGKSSLLHCVWWGLPDFEENITFFQQFDNHPVIESNDKFDNNALKHEVYFGIIF